MVEVIPPPGHMGDTVNLGDLALQSAENVDIRGGRVVRLAELGVFEADIDVLRVAKSAALALLTVSGLATFSGQIQAADGSAAAPAYSFASNPDSGIYLAGTDIVAIATSGVNRLQVDEDGYVGIGNAIAGQMDVLNSAGNLVIGDGGSGVRGATIYGSGIGVIAFADALTLAGSAAGSIVYDHSTDTLTLSTAGTQRVYANATGLGIGVTPSFAAHLNAGQFAGPNGTAAAPTYSFSGDPNNGMYLSAADQVSIATAGAARINVDSAGKVGIGKAPTTTLDVNGTITGSAVATGTLSASGQITSTLATGTAPLVIASTTQVNNLNVSQLIGGTWAVPGSIGATTPNAGAFTTLSASGLSTFTGIGRPTRTITGATTLTSADGVVVCSNSGANYNVTLPAANAWGAGKTGVLQIFRDTSGVTISATLITQGGNTIQAGAVTTTLAAGTGCTVVSDGNNIWYVY